MLHYTNAGHNPPLLLRAEKTLPLDQGGLVLGAEEKEVYEKADIKLQPGDLLLFYTDGVTEALNSKHEVFGMPKLTALLRQSKDLGAREVIDRILEAVRTHSAGAPQSDDVTLVAMKVE